MLRNFPSREGITSTIFAIMSFGSSLPLWFTEEPVDHFLEGFALDKVHVIAEPA